MAGENIAVFWLQSTSLSKLGSNIGVSSGFIFPVKSKIKLGMLRGLMKGKLLDEELISSYKWFCTFYQTFYFSCPRGPGLTGARGCTVRIPHLLLGIHSNMWIWLRNYCVCVCAHGRLSKRLQQLLLRSLITSGAVVFHAMQQTVDMLIIPELHALREYGF